MYAKKDIEINTIYIYFNFEFQGANSHGQLGLSYESEMCMTPHIVNSPIDLKFIRKMQGGGTHFMILDNKGKLHVCGCNNKGQLGIDSKENKSSIFAAPKTEIVYIDIACGWDSSAAIDENKNLFVWGSNAFSQIGFNAKTHPYFTSPVVLTLPHNEKVKKITFGLRYMCILCDDQTVYIVGRWKFPQNSEIIKHNDTDFHRIQINPELKIEDIASGANHIICSSSHSVTGIGDNKFCQSVSLTNLNERIKYIRSGWSHNGLQTENGNVYLWGRNSYGQLASTTVEKSKELVLLTGIEGEITEFFLGSEHGIAITNNGRIYTWGWNEHANCGNGDTSNV